MNGKLTLSTHCNYSKNTKGHDFFVGDIHGKLSLLMHALHQIHFDVNVDRLFSVGDVIDRGEASFNCLLLTKENWFIPVMGNHEQFLSDIDNSDVYKKSIWYANGGAWWECVNNEQRREAKSVVFRNFSLTLSVDTLAGKVGVVHAQYPFARWPINEDDINKDALYKLLWSRENRQSGIENASANASVNAVEGVDFIVSGHTPINKARLKGRQLFIDTGCGHVANERINNPHLTLCEFKENSIEIYAVTEQFFEVSTIVI